MYKTQEIRWFFPTALIGVEPWFKSLGLTFSKTKSRTDCYLRLPDTLDLGIKLREQKIELKQRHDRPRLESLSDEIVGNREAWTKWSFAVSKADTVSASIISRRKADWIKIKKSTLAIKLGTGHNRTIQIFPVAHQISHGCQIDYTRLDTPNTRWFTLGFEWFGEKQIKLPQQILRELFGTTRLLATNSMGYAEFLTREVFSHHHSERQNDK